MAEWLVERGIGEDRAVLLGGDCIVEARILPEGELLAGTVLDARLVARMPERGQGVVAWDGGEALVAPLPRGVTQGALTRVEIVRPAIPEPGKPKRARARPAAQGAEFGPGHADLPPHRLVRAGESDLFEAAGWSEVLEEAATGIVRFPGGTLSLHPTPAMTLIDVDGTLAPADLAVAGARAAAEAIRRLDIAGSIGIDLPGSGDRTARQRAAEAIDAVLPQPFERTAVNGFGFVQIVRPRRRRSLLEVVAMDGPLAHARALLRRAEHAPGHGTRTLSAHPAVIAALEARPDWVEALGRRTGTAIALRAEPGPAISAGHVQALQA